MTGTGKRIAPGGFGLAAAFLALLLAACHSSSKPPAVPSPLSPPGGTHPPARAPEGPAAKPPENLPVKAPEAPAAKAQEKQPAKDPAAENWMNSSRELAEMVLLGLREKDGELLESLRVTEREYKEVLFPEFPVASGNSPPDFHWFLLDNGSRAGLENALGSWGGEDFELVDVVVTRGIQDYRTFRILSKVELKVRARNASEIRQLRVFGSVVEREGRYKILSYKN